MEPTPTWFTSLPTPVVHRVVLLLPVEDRLRSIMVCRAWEAAFSERSLWTHLDLPIQRNYLRVSERVGPSEPLLRCAAAHAGGELETLSVDLGRLSFGPLLNVVTANAGSLRELHLSRAFGCDLEARSAKRMTVLQAENLLSGAPQLRALSVDDCFYVDNTNEARRTLRNEAPFGPLRLRTVRVNFPLRSAAEVITFSADVVAHSTLVELELCGAPPDAAALGALADAAVALRLQSIGFYDCHFNLASAPALSRLAGMAELRSLSFMGSALWGVGGDDFAAMLADALRGNTTLTSFSLTQYPHSTDPPAGVVSLLRVLAGHASLQSLSMLGMNPHNVGNGDVVIGNALGALIAANTPALTKLQFTMHILRNACLRPLCVALPSNSYLHTLEFNSGLIFDEFKAGVLLPAVRANTSLRVLNFKLPLADDDRDTAPDLVLDELVRVVRERSSQTA